MRRAGADRGVRPYKPFRRGGPCGRPPHNHSPHAKASVIARAQRARSNPHPPPVGGGVLDAPRALLLCAAGGSLSFCGERKGGKNAAKTNGFGILSAAEVQPIPTPFCLANRDGQVMCLAFGWPLRLHPPAAHADPRWSGGAGINCAPAVRGDDGCGTGNRKGRPYEGACRAG